MATPCRMSRGRAAFRDPAFPAVITTRVSVTYIYQRPLYYIVYSDLTTTGLRRSISASLVFSSPIQKITFHLIFRRRWEHHRKTKAQP